MSMWMGCMSSKREDLLTAEVLNSLGRFRRKDIVGIVALVKNVIYSRSACKYWLHNQIRRTGFTEGGTDTADSPHSSLPALENIFSFGLSGMNRIGNDCHSFSW